MTIAVGGTRLTEPEEKYYPNAVLRKTRSGKGLLIIVPDPVTMTSHTYVTSIAFVNFLLQGNLKSNLLGCVYLGEGDYHQFLNKEEKKLNVINTGGENPLGFKAIKKRKEMQLKDVDDW